jgi:hypothetical protein
MEEGSSSAGAEPAQESGSKGRRIAFTVLSAVFAAAALGALFGAAVIIAWIDNTDGGIHRVHDMGFGALYGAILTVGLAVQVFHPERRVSAFYQIVAVALAVVLGGLVAASGYAVLGVLLGVAYLVLLLLHPYRSEVLRPAREGFSPLLAALAVVGAIPLLWFASSMATLQRNGVPSDPHVKQDHWTTMAAMAIGIVLVGLLSSLKIRGWRISAWSAGAALFLYGLASVVYPHKAGAEGTEWGLAAILGGLVFVAAAEWEARRSPALVGSRP